MDISNKPYGLKIHIYKKLVHIFSFSSFSLILTSITHFIPGGKNLILTNFKSSTQDRYLNSGNSIEFLEIGRVKSGCCLPIQKSSEVSCPIWTLSLDFWRSCWIITWAYLPGPFKSWCHLCFLWALLGDTRIILLFSCLVSHIGTVCPDTLPNHAQLWGLFQGKHTGSLCSWVSHTNL